jgi:hypothetical protein
MFSIVGSPHTCPVCTDFRFKRSTQGWFRHVAILVGFVPFRCLHCQKRVWRFAPLTKLPTKKKKGAGQAVTASDHTPPTGTDVPAAESKGERPTAMNGERPT